MSEDYKGMGEDWARDFLSWNPKGFEETDGQCEAMDIAAGLAENPADIEFIAEEIYEGICKVKEEIGN